LLPEVPSVTFLLVRGASGLQLTPFISDEPLFCPSILESLSYPQVKDNTLVSVLKSLSSIEIDLSNLPPFRPSDQTTRIVGRVFGFNSDNDGPLLQMCGHP
jgi:hypothetical protein